MGQRTRWHVTRGYEPILRQLGLDGESVFNHGRIQVWRKLPDRENCTLDGTTDDGRAIRLHIKRYPAQRWGATPAEVEARGIELLESRDIDTVPLVAVGRDGRGRSCLVVEDLAGYQPADRMLEAGVPFSRLLAATAELAAKLHGAGLHHRDLYLNHFFASVDDGPVKLRLIDCARVRALPLLFKQRWIVKDLAQFWYSTLHQKITDEQRLSWLKIYAAKRKMALPALLKAIQGKVKSIARHDVKLNRAQPHRNVPIPS